MPHVWSAASCFSFFHEEYIMIDKRIVRVSAAIGMTALSALGGSAAWAASAERSI